MVRPTRDTIQSGVNGWDGSTNDNFIRIFDGPLAIALHTGDQSDLESTFAAAAFDKCLIWVDHTVDGWTLYSSNGTTWSAFSGGGGGGGGGGPMTIQYVTGTATADSDENLLVVCTGTTYTVTLPSAAAVVEGHRITIKRVTSGTVTIDGDSTDTLDAFSSLALDVALMSLSLVSDGISNWNVV